MRLNSDKVRALYEAGMSQLEIAVALGGSQSNVSYVMRKLGITRRKAIRRNQRGEANPIWKGNDIGYKSAHNRVYAVRGRPQKCEQCGTDDPNKRYEWANLTGKYPDPNDYKRMCRSCHCKHDNLIRNLGTFAKPAKTVHRG